MSQATAKKRSDDLIARDYQLNLLQVAMQKNVILCLGTGSGKTFISVLLVKELLWQTRDSQKVTIFLATTVPLVKQQCVVLQKFIDAEIDFYVGDKGVDLWSIDQWRSEISKNQILVMTPMILSNILNANYIDLSQVNVVVMDECHATTGNHPYVQIMQYHYIKIDKPLRPKILGLTASVINKKVSASSVRAHVEAICNRLDSTLATAMESVNFSTRPTEILVEFASCTIPVITCDHCQLDSDISELLKNVGPFGTLKVLKHRMKIANNIIQMDAASEERLAKTREILDYATRACEQLEAWMSAVDSHSRENCYSRGKTFAQIFNTGSNSAALSFPPKFTKLLEMIDAYHTKSIDICCVIFAKTRHTVLALTCVFQMLRLRFPERFGYLKSALVVGQASQSQFAPRESQTLDMDDEFGNIQGDALEEFRDRRINILVATSVIEEGVDIPQCNLVVRFDVPDNVRSYVQSRGRARAKPSVYAVLAESDKFAKIRTDLESFKQSEEAVLRCCLEHQDEIDDEEVEKELVGDPDLPPIYAFPETPKDSAVITAQSARQTVQWYCDTLGNDRYVVLQPKFNMNILEEGLIEFSVTFPRESKLYPEVIRGKPLESKTKAKISACLEACKRLYDMGELTENLIPRKRKKPGYLNPMEEHFPMITEEIIKNGIRAERTTSSLLSPVILPNHVGVPDALVLKFEITTEEPLFDENASFRTFMAHDEPTTFGLLLQVGTKNYHTIPDFPIFSRSGRERVHVQHLEHLKISIGLLSLIRSFHEYIINKVLALKHVSIQEGALPLFVPLLGEEIDVDLLQRIQFKIPVELNINSVVTFTDEREAGHKDCTCFVEELFTKDGIDRIIVKKIPRNLDMHHPITEKCAARERTDRDLKEKYAKWVEYCQVESLSASQWSKALMLPSIMYRLNRLLLCDELRIKLVMDGLGQLNTFTPWPPLQYSRIFKPKNSADLRDKKCVSLQDIKVSSLDFLCKNKRDDRGPSPGDLLSAFSPLRAQDIVDSERYEVIGDSFLKIAVTFHLFHQFGRADEGELTYQRCRMVSNLNLCSLAFCKDYIFKCLVEAEKFQAHTNFRAPGCTLESAQGAHFYKYKILADSIEALIGVYLERLGPIGALDLLKYLGLSLGRDGADFANRFDLSTQLLKEDTSNLLHRFRYDIHKVESILGYTFNNKYFVIEALTHQSYRFNKVTRSYERLEFLGDAVIDYLVSIFIYQNNPSLDPGQMTDVRSSIVCNNTLARAVVEHGLHKLLKHHSPILSKLIDKFIKSLNSNRTLNDLLNDDDIDEIDNVDVPKPLGDLFESLMGAVFLDCNKDFDRVWSVVCHLIGVDVLKDMLVNIRINPVRKIMEMHPGKCVFEKPEILPEEKVVVLRANINGIDFKARARNKKACKIGIAKKALRYFGNETGPSRKRTCSEFIIEAMDLA